MLTCNKSIASEKQNTLFFQLCKHRPQVKSNILLASTSSTREKQTAEYVEENFFLTCFMSFDYNRQIHEA